MTETTQGSSDGALSVRSTTLSPLKYRLFVMIWLSSLVASFGSAVQAVGAAWRLTELHQPADIVALVQTAASLPIMLLALPAGAFADMHDRRRVMLGAQTVMLAIALTLVALEVSHASPPWALLALTFALASGTAFFSPGLQASVGTVVPRFELAAAVALNILAFNVARSVGPALGGLIVAAGGPTVAFAISAASIATVIILLLAWRPDTAPRVPRRPIGHAIADGLVFIIGSPQVRTILVRALSFTTAGSAAWALMPLVSRDLVGGGSVEFGLLLGSLGAGAVLGAATSTWFRQRLSSEAIIRGAGIVYGVGCLATALRPGLWPTLLILVASGAAGCRRCPGSAWRASSGRRGRWSGASRPPSAA